MAEVDSHDPNQPDTATAQTKDPLLGRVLNGRFNILEPIGAGGMGKVYKAIQSPLDRVVAVKVLNPQFSAQDTNFVRRFVLEASLTSKLRHPNTVTVIDYGQTEDNVFYIAMEYLDGRTLAEVLAKEGALSWQRALHIGQQVGRSLREAHKFGVIHRDLKPANVMLLDEADNDQVKVLDFGLVKSFTPDSQVASLDAHITQAGMLLGSPQYMAPEQARSVSDPRSDVYSFGVLLYEMLVGRPPFMAKDYLEVIVKHMREAPPPFRVQRPDLIIPPAVEALVARCLQKDPAARFQSMDELLEAMRTIGGTPVTHSGVQTRPLTGSWAAAVAPPPQALRNTPGPGELQAPGVGQPMPGGRPPSGAYPAPLQGAPQSGQYPQPPSGAYPQRPPSGSYPQPPPGPYPQRPPSGPYPQPPSGAYSQRPPSGAYPPPSQSGPHPQVPPSGAYPQPSQSGPYPQPPTSGAYPQPYPPGAYPPPSQSGPYAQSAIPGPATGVAEPSLFASSTPDAGGGKGLWVALGLVALLVGGGAAYWFGHREKPATAQPPEATAQPEAKPAPANTATPAPQPAGPSNPGKPVRFRVSSDPSGARIFLGARDLGATPLTFEMPAQADGTATAELVFILDGYHPLAVTAGGSGDVVLSQRLQKKSGRSSSPETIRVASVSPGAGKQLPSIGSSSEEKIDAPTMIAPERVPVETRKAEGASAPAPAPVPMVASASAAAPAPARPGREVLPFGEGMSRPEQLKGAPITLPREAIQARVEGLMIVKCIINTSGRLESCHVLKTLPYVEKAVLDSLYARVYRPVTYQGRTVAVEYVFDVHVAQPR